MIVAADLRASDVGAEVAFVLNEPVAGRLDAVDHTGVRGRTTLTVGGTEYVVWPDTLVAFPSLGAELAIASQPGRAHVWERARQAADLHAIVHGDGPR